MLPYNTQLPPLRLRAYGREVQEMVERALAMTDREERTRYAHQIVQVMKMVAAKTKSGIDNEVQIWNHLARIADYRLDIDFPCEIEPHTEAVRPGRLAYPDHRLQMKNYGKLVEQLFRRIESETDIATRNALLRQAAAHMRTTLAAARNGHPDQRRIVRDIVVGVNGALTESEVADALEQ